MNWLDISILVLLFIALLNGYRRGFFRELSTSIGFILGIIFAITHADWLAYKLGERIHFLPPSVVYVTCFILILAAFTIVLKIIGRYFYAMVKLSPPRLSHKVGGGMCGIVKGLVAISLLFLIFVFPAPIKTMERSMQESVMTKPIRLVVPFIYDNTIVLHPNSESFVAEIRKGIMLSGASGRSHSLQAALDKGALMGMNDSDVRALSRLQKYYSQKEREIK